ncbi:hypothetical protein VP01_113g7 [Puccinia sorghi]|uniref:Peptidase S8/S53 domain-containing protein n=1 Tax=Puccinia sorghi TaxID=27349 RepID=A0A0L6VRY7_9BASI|nr:hypothetical protein VP01_113g7 [Puccinia sorghi]
MDTGKYVIPTAEIILLSLGSPGVVTGKTNLECDQQSAGKERHDHNCLFRESGNGEPLCSKGDMGQDGLLSALLPASTRATISVGLVDSSSLTAWLFQDLTGKSLMYYKNQVLPDGNFQLYFTSNNLTNEDDASMYMHERNVLLFCCRSCFISEKAHHPKARGAKLIFFYMVSSLSPSFFLSLDKKSRVIGLMPSEVLGIKVVGVLFEDAQHIAMQLKKDPTEFRLSFNTGASGTHTQFEFVALETFELQPVFAIVMGLPLTLSARSQQSLELVATSFVSYFFSTFPMVDGGCVSFHSFVSMGRDPANLGISSQSSLSGNSMSAPQLASIAALILSHQGKKGLDCYAMQDCLTTSSQVVNYSSKVCKPHIVYTLLPFPK